VRPAEEERLAKLGRDIAAARARHERPVPMQFTASPPPAAEDAGENFLPGMLGLLATVLLRDVTHGLGVPWFFSWPLSVGVGCAVIELRRRHHPR
jgi:hypothetical protein